METIISKEAVLESIRAHLTAARGGEIASEDLIGKHIEGLPKKEFLGHHFGAAMGLMNMYKIKKVDGLTVKQVQKELEDELSKIKNES